MAKLIEPDDELKLDTPLTFTRARELLGNNIEVVDLGGYLLLIGDRPGPYNEEASRLLNDPVLGSVIYCAVEDLA